MAQSKERRVINPFKPMINQLPNGIRNRYVLVLMLFLLWMILFDKANVWTQFKLNRTVKKLNQDKVYYNQKLIEVQREKADIQNNPEKFAREHYYMKAADEDVFVIDQQ
jgi:cell division protein FtsB